MKRKSTKFDQLCDVVLQELDKLVSGIGGALPIALSKIATAVAISDLKFAPLLSSAGLEDLGNNFVIWINTEANGVPPHIKERWTAVDDWNVLSPPVRFSIAHEIIHVLFKKFSRLTKLPLTKDIEDLERRCNQMARLMVLPRTAFASEIGDQVLDTQRVRDVVRRAGISPQVFLFRSDLPDVARGLSNVEGLLAVAIEREGEIKLIDYRAWGAAARTRFGKRGNGELESIDEKGWNIDGSPSSPIWRESHYANTIEISGRLGEVVRCKIEVTRGERTVRFLSLHVERVVPPGRSQDRIPGL